MLFNRERLLAIQRLYDAENGIRSLAVKVLGVLEDLAPMLIGSTVRDLKVARTAGGRGHT